MENLSIHRVLAEAPAAARRKNASKEGLIDTSEFLRRVDRLYDYHPVLAVQGTTHEDSANAEEKNGRHLVVAAGRSGAVFLLNSHTKDRRAHIGVGFWKADGFLIGPTSPVQRWAGYDTILEGLMARSGDLNKVSRSLQAWVPNATEIQQITRAVVRKGYMEGVAARPAPHALCDPDSWEGSARDLGFEMIRRMRAGNLEAATKGGRRVKGIRRPDGLFHAGMMVFAILMAQGQLHGKIDEDIEFGRVEERLVRP